MMSFFGNSGDLLTRRRQPPPGAKYELLAITPDDRFYSSLAYTTAPHGWVVRWARSVNGAMGILACRSIPVILYDCYNAGEDWTTSIERLKLIPGDPCVILAARGVDEDLWRQAIARRVYDVVCRNLQSGHLIATLQFAWNWKADGRVVRRVTSRSV
jgi:DNA-binding NtrC family response regulator